MEVKRIILIVALFFSLLVSSASRAQTRPTTSPSAASPSSAAIIALHGEVDDYIRDSLIRKFAEARRLGATTVILDMDTFGGMVASGLEITLFLRGQTDLHIIAYVNPKAYSAGAMIAVACDEIVMAPSAVIGDCAPIEINNIDGKLVPLPPTERAKQQSPILNDFDASADRNGYSRRLLESMVALDRVVHYVQSPKGEKRFVDDKEYAKLTAEGWKPVAGLPNPINEADRLFTVQTGEAIKLGLAKGESASAEALASERGLHLVADLTPGAGEQFVEFLGKFWVRGTLMLIFFLSMYIAMASPGHGAAEAIGICSLALLVGIPLLTGYAQWWEVVLIFVGLGLLAFEIFVFPGHGVAAVMGLILMLSGLLLTFVGREPAGLPGTLPSLGQTWTNLKAGLLVITCSLLAWLFLSIWLRRFLPKLPYFNRLILNTTSGGVEFPASINVSPENAWPGVGTEGKAVTDLRPSGSAEFVDLSVGDKRTIAVISESGYVEAGARLVVRESKGNRVLVRSI